MYREIDQFWQVIDVLVSEKRDMAVTRRFFTRVLEHGPPTKVITDKAAVYPPILDEVAPGAWDHTEPYANNRIEADHSQFKRRLHPMRGLTSDRRSQDQHRRVPLDQRPGGTFPSRLRHALRAVTAELLQRLNTRPAAGTTPRRAPHPPHPVLPRSPSTVTWSNHHPT